MEEQTQQAKKIWIVTAEPESDRPEAAGSARTGGGASKNPWHSKAAATAARGVQISTDVLEREMSEFVDGIGQMFLVLADSVE